MLQISGDKVKKERNCEINLQQCAVNSAVMLVLKSQICSKRFDMLETIEHNANAAFAYTDFFVKNTR